MLKKAEGRNPELFFSLSTHTRIGTSAVFCVVFHDNMIHAKRGKCFGGKEKLCLYILLYYKGFLFDLSCLLLVPRLIRFVVRSCSCCRLSFFPSYVLLHVNCHFLFVSGLLAGFHTLFRRILLFISQNQGIPMCAFLVSKLCEKKVSGSDNSISHKRSSITHATFCFP